jgi:hypothetical protein
MRTLRQSALAIVIAAVSTAALGPGVFFRPMPEMAGGSARVDAIAAATTLEDLQALFHTEAAHFARDMLPTALAEGWMPEAALLPVDFVGAPLPKLALAAGNPAFHAARPDDGAMPGGGAAGAVSAIGNAAAPGRGAQLSRSGNMVTALGDPASGLSAGPAVENVSVIDLDDPGLFARDISQLPLQAVGPIPADANGAGAANGGIAGTASAVPEPATGMLMALGFAGLLTVGRIGRARPGAVRTAKAA